MGGPSAEREISFLSGNAVLEALREKGVDAHAFDPAERAAVRAEARGLRARVHRAARPLRRGRHRAGRARDAGHSVHRQRRDGLGAGDGQVAHQARLARERHSDAALSASSTRATDWMRVVAELGLPLIVKPAREGSTIGITKVAGVDHDELALAYGDAAKHDDLVLVEEFVAGVGADRVDPRRARAAADPDRGAAGQLRLPQQVLLRRDEVLLPVRARRRRRSARSGRSRSRRSASSAARGWGRLDLILRADGSFQFLEVNTSPGMTGHSLVPMAAKAGGHRVRRPVRRDPAGRACGMTRGS